ncbi:helix-turn-helix domain-containing protein [Sphingomonas sp. QA11]|uniref:helix-turn-helix domain-containing protein n=1 Tax=Sphingomonas sp. QA11 TaxID=2950605 RepID=UPI00234A839D|nr:helix-turn-helix domain-containing protein [Sphingomonas sp. QA11]WCM25955.1 helix-turn-helix domain-containing protein [Sphingomonas sp. QA11]
MATHLAHDPITRVARSRSVRADGALFEVRARRWPISAQGASHGPGQHVPLSDATIVALVRSVVTEQLSRPLDIEALVWATGVGERAIRRALDAELGLSAAGFIHQFRLSQVRAWLSTNRKTRTLAGIAAALGFSTGAMFSRSYRKRFGESVAVW